MTHIDRGFWTFNEDKYLEVSQGLAQSEKYLKKLFELLNKNKIDNRYKLIDIRNHLKTPGDSARYRKESYPTVVHFVHL